MQMCFIFYFYLFLTVSQKMPGGGGLSGTAVFCENLVAICTHDRRLWIWIYTWVSTENLWIWIWMANFISTASLGESPQTLSWTQIMKVRGFCCKVSVIEFEQANL